MTRRSINAKGVNANLSRPDREFLYSGSTSQDQIRKMYSMVNIITDASSEIVEHNLMR